MNQRTRQRFDMLVYPQQVKSLAEDVDTFHCVPGMNYGRPSAYWVLDIAGPFEPWPHYKYRSGSKTDMIASRVSNFLGLNADCSQIDGAIYVQVRVDAATKARLIRKEYQKQTKSG